MSAQTSSHFQSATVDVYDAVVQARRERDRYIVQLLGRTFGRAYGAARRWLAHRRTIAQLKQLDARTLADIGLSGAALGNGFIQRQQDDRVQSVMHGSTLRPVAEVSQLAALSAEPSQAPAIVLAAIPANNDTRHAA